MQYHEQIEANRPPEQDHQTGPAPIRAQQDALRAWMAKRQIWQVTVQARSLGLRASQNMGSTWHGALGKVLHERHPSLYTALYGDNSGVARPYVLRPPRYDDTLAEGAPFEFSLLLMGDGVHYSDSLCMALADLARQGVGPGRGRFAIDAIDVGSVSLPARPAQAARALYVQFCTPTLLKEDNRHVLSSPSLLLLSKRLIGRARQLWPQATLPPALAQTLLQQATQAACVDAQLAWHSTRRYSARQKAWMPFGGLCGTLRYQPVAPALQDWLAWAQWLHIGNKTTFGYGQVQVQAVAHADPWPCMP
ncbi:CRISPR system precrRNA processing endoribonuclease RAMP protein Cas6 [Laribacter hongkongensis]|uniref:CRISPR system precrRNA processing endoribonuclease RAMP protein Cas6 n=1 Tax=Laribacter hongkongensis TaxID=168471 RepID=UPI001EFCE523|nr:CRISPR system precrRNA processing endoribonuclease RAMP protein Cas6 [Laribacter hongkongensis]MCG9059798.1 CRISPR system precrRNA processing endoribonuclease RAMP protein Cas6 [Laribacter hongkongensis]MCG9084140.1 CRISPR system precrRNA processing endoribonuclease RAMP protein Cas6 [Laribacter hongkongensis]MCG9086538.1 CRISPR system precrRNA processing endoribonuclease RAMP protein Cas6 [Laribacter hongkongensis]